MQIFLWWAIQPVQYTSRLSIGRQLWWSLTERNGKSKYNYREDRMGCAAFFPHKGSSSVIGSASVKFYMNMNTVYLIENLNWSKHANYCVACFSTTCLLKELYWIILHVNAEYLCECISYPLVWNIGTIVELRQMVITTYHFLLLMF